MASGHVKEDAVWARIDKAFDQAEQTVQVVRSHHFVETVSPYPSSTRVMRHPEKFETGLAKAQDS